MGYHRPVSAFNPGKQSEHRERRFFVERVDDAAYQPLRQAQRAVLGRCHA